jgi:NitT/TauT family transport system substrate-binding protein
MPTQRMTRRRFLDASLGASVALLAASATKTSRAQALRDIKLTLSWIPDGTSIPCYVAKTKGFWAKRGLSVSIARGNGSTAAVLALAGGQFDFCFASSPAGVLASVQGLKITHVACTSYNSTMSVAVLADSAIKAPKDLEGKKLGCVVDSGDFPFLPVFARKAGFDLAKVNIVHTNANIRNQLLVQKQIDAMTGYAASSAPLLVSQGVGIRYFEYANYGLSLYGNTLMTRTEFLENEPEVCAAIVDGLMEGVEYSLLHPTEALDILMQDLPEMAAAPRTREQARLGLGVNTVTLLQGPVRTQGLGYAEPAAFEQMIDLTMKYLAKPTDARPAVAEMLTNRFVSKLHLTDAQWTQIADSVAPFNRYIL